MTSPYTPLSPSSPPSRSFSPSSPPARSPTQSLRALELSEEYPDGDGDRPRHGRSNTITSLGGFEFEHALLPLTLSGEGDAVGGGRAGGEEQREERHVSLLHGIALVVGAQVGSGIFSSPGVVVGEVGSVGASLLVWIVSGVLAWTGASSYAELGCAIPLSGGSQAYLAYAFGPMTSYLFTWAAVSVLKPGSAAMISLIFGEYVNRLVFHALSSSTSPVPEWSVKLTAAIAIILVSVLNLISRTMGTDSTVVLTTIKIGSLIFVAVLGLIALINNGPGEGLSASGFFEDTKTELSSYAIALYSGLWAFDGWDSCCYVAGEMRNTQRDLPRALHSSMAIVLCLFVLANVSYFLVLDPATVASSNTVALDFGAETIGRFGAVVFSALVSISCFGALNGSFYTTARLIYAASREHFLPSVFSRLHHRRRTPDNAIALQASLSLFFIIFGGGFRAILNFFSVASWTFYLLTVLGLLVLRAKEPHLERPYRAWLITPVVFCVVAMFLLLMPIFAAPWEAFAAFVFISAGVPMYYLTSRSRAQSAKGFTADDEGSAIRATLTDAWDRFKDDVQYLLPRKLRREGTVTKAPRALDDGEERRGMLRREEQLEMSERR
ncbi:hypothetical protein IAR55_000203 [Kwoniella newhampshirensis]|uniref:L-methionine transporter n=1 Tax=Kwoniella newhampshirensis TaxID=1651941 RepID=A0AAW0Z635_9TREE